MSVDNWTMAQAKREFAAGYFTRCRVVSAPLGSGWSLVLSAGMKSGTLVDAREGGMRIFKTLDAAVSALRDIGFRVESLSVG